MPPGPPSGEDGRCVQRRSGRDTGAGRQKRQNLGHNASLREQRGAPPRPAPPGRLPVLPPELRAGHEGIAAPLAAAPAAAIPGPLIQPRKKAPGAAQPPGGRQGQQGGQRLRFLLRPLRREVGVQRLEGLRHGCVNPVDPALRRVLQVQGRPGQDLRLPAPELR